MFGLTHQNKPREIAQIATSNLTPIHSYYFVLIYVTDVTEKTQPTVSKTTARGSRITRYSVQIELADEAMVQNLDREAYETMHNDFRLFSDRLADLLEKQYFIGTAPKLVLERDPANDRAIEKTNLSGSWTDTEGVGWASLYCQLRMSFIDGCADTAGLYQR